MSNRIISRFNEIKKNAPRIAAFFQKQYLIEEPFSRVQIDYTLDDTIDMFFCVKSYDLPGDNTENFQAVSSLSQQILNALKTSQIPFAFVIKGASDGISAFYGTSYLYGDIIYRTFNNNLRNPLLQNMWIKPEDLLSIQRYNGYICGAKPLSAGQLDTALNSLSGLDYILDFYCIPCNDSEVLSEIDQVNLLLSELEKVSNDELSFGSNRQRRFYSDNHDVTDAIQVLTSEINKLHLSLTSGLWKVIIHIGAKTESTYRFVTSTVLSMFNNSHSDYDRSVPCSVRSNNYGINKTTWSYPVSFLGEVNYGGIYSQSLVSIVDSNCLATLVSLPTQSHGNYNVNHVGVSSKNADVLSSQIRHEGLIQPLRFGQLKNGQELYISLNDFRQHAFVAGAPRYGKTTSVKKIIANAHKNGIPFIVIEAAKKEYWELIYSEGLKKIRIYSSGNDALALRINPFQPEVYTSLNYHIQGIINAFLSIFDQEDPLPQIITKLVYVCYEKRGWDTNTRYSGNEDLDIPFLSDMLLYLDEVVDSIGYDDEIRKRMKGVVRVRIEHLLRSAGKCFNTQENLTAKDLFSESSVIELDDFSQDIRPFAASIIAIKVNEYTRSCKLSGELKRILVLEEAHHILPNPELKSSSKNAARCSLFFSDMLAEVSAYGTGIIVVDQRPSIISPAAIANTSIKIIHNIHEGMDLDSTIKSMALPEHVGQQFRSLEIGQAIISTPNTNRIHLVCVDGKLEKARNSHIGCIFCQLREECEKKISHISLFEENYLKGNGISKNTLLRCMTSISDKEGEKLTKNDMICLAGKLCGLACTDSDNPIIIRQQLFDFCQSLEKGVTI